MIANIWNIFVSSNTFNFFVMLIILAYILKKADIVGLIENSKLKVVNRIKDSENEKQSGLLNLEEANKSVKNLDTELKTILNDASQKAENSKNKILSEADKKVLEIENNVSKRIKADEQQASSRLIDKTLKQSNEKAIQKILKLLEENPELHNKIIDKCIGQIQ